MFSSQRSLVILRTCLLVAGLVCASMILTSTAAAQATCAPGINDGTTNGANSTFLGPNVYVITPSMWTCDIQALMNTLNQESQFSTNRYAVLFAPGTYGSSSLPLTAQVGYYEQIAGLGTTPTQTQITGGFAADQIIFDSNGNSTGLTQNFWRSLENMSETPVGTGTNPTTGASDWGTLDWGVSQGASLRRMQINGDLWYANSTPVPGSANACAEASGGFTADSQIVGKTNFCSQQQWYTRNSEMDGPVSTNVWNFVFSGDTGNGVPQPSFPGGALGDANVTLLPDTPVSIEKPFLQIDSNGYDEGDYSVWVPVVQSNSSGTSWSQNPGSNGYAEPMSDFFIATPSSSIDDINNALAAGYSLILTPGIYQYSQPIHVTNPWTVVLGLGFPTIVPQAGNPAIVIDDVDAVQLAGVIVDAGPVTSPILVEVGQPGIVNQSHTYPTSLHDVYFRIGGGTPGSANVSLEVDSSDVILDNIWAWRADHGNAGTFGWTINTANTGLIVNGENVYALGLAVEHYQQDQVVWNGDSGGTIFYQSEEPYDVPNQAAWINPDGGNGYPSYNVASSVCSHYAYGLGVYSFFNQGQSIVDDTAILVPASEYVYLQGLTTVFLNGSGQISSIIDGQGPVANAVGAPEQIAAYSGNAACTPFNEPPGSTVVPGVESNSAYPGYVSTQTVNYNPNNFNTDRIMQAIETPHPDLVMISAHRGIHSMPNTQQGVGIPENSLRAIGEAAKEGWETIEIDAKYLTNDGQLILSHDATLGREWCGNRNQSGLATNWSYSPWIPPNTNSTNDAANPLISSLQLSDTRKWYSDNTVLRDTVSVINDYLADPDPSGQPWYGAACHSTFGWGQGYAPTLAEVYDYIRKYNIQMVVELDIQSVAVAQAAFNVLTSETNANGEPALSSTIFKMPAALFPTPADFVNAFGVPTEQNQPGYNDVNFNPVFHTSGIAPVSSTNPFGSEQAMNNWINAFETYNGTFGRINIVAIEVSMKDPVGTPNGGILSTVLPVAQNNVVTGNPMTISQFNPVGEYYPNNDYTQTPEFFSSQNGSCCEPLSAFLFNNPISLKGHQYADLPEDQNDNRPSDSFLVGMGAQMITTDLPSSVATYAEGIGMRNICYMQTTGCPYAENYVYNPSFEIGPTGTTWWNPSTNDNNSLWNEGYYEEFWDSNPYTNDLSQYLGGIPDGTYTLGAWVFDSGGENSAYMWAWSSAGWESVNFPGVDNWTYIQIPNVPVTNGQLYLGFYVDANANNYAAMGAVTLYQN